MKKSIVLVLLIMFLLLATGCENFSSNGDSSDELTSSPTVDANFHDVDTVADAKIETQISDELTEFESKRKSSELLDELTEFESKRKSSELLDELVEFEGVWKVSELYTTSRRVMEDYVRENTTLIDMLIEIKSDEIIFDNQSFHCVSVMEFDAKRLSDVYNIIYRYAVEMCERNSTGAEIADNGTSIKRIVFNCKESGNGIEIFVCNNGDLMMHIGEPVGALSEYPGFYELVKVKN